MSGNTNVQFHIICSLFDSLRSGVIKLKNTREKTQKTHSKREQRPTLWDVRDVIVYVKNFPKNNMNIFVLEHIS